MYPKLPSKKEIYNAYIKDKNIKKDNELVENNNIDIYDLNDYQDNEFFDKVYSLYQYGMLEEVLSVYSLDDLYNNLKEDELEMIGLNGYHR